MEERRENTIEENTSMEELKVDENDKEVSMEDDIWGTQSLLMSESEEEVSNDLINPRPKKEIYHKRAIRILDSDDEDNGESKQQLHPNKEKMMANKKKLSTLIDSDSDIEGDVSKGEINNTETREAAEENFKQQEQTENQHKNFLRGSSDFKSTAAGPIQKSNKGKKSSLIDSESSDAESVREMSISDLETSAREANFKKNCEGISNEKRNLKVVRASAKKAMVEMQAIQSEQQRLHREACISIPYHKPRKHTLDEFLMRRTIIQPEKGSPVAAAVQSRSLKMTTEELEEYAKLMEDRAKEATEFFKSESENETEDVLKDNEDALDKPEETTEQNVSLISEIPVQENVGECNNATDLTEDQLKFVLSDEENTGQTDKDREKPTCSKVLITEVIELPKLDMNTMNISPIKQHTPRSSLNIKQLLAEKKLADSPSLSGDPNKLIDLETGDLIEKKITGMDNLMKRLMSTIKGRKLKNLDTCSILSVENGKLEISKVNISRTETNDVQKEAKPGAAYFELKRNLREIIKKKRIEEMNKKQEDEVEHNACLDDDDEEDESTGMYVGEYEPDDESKNKVVVDEEENAVMNEDDELEIVDDEQDEESVADDNEWEDYGDEEDEDEKNENYRLAGSLDKSERKNRIIKAFDDTDEEEGENDDFDFLKTQPQTTQPSLLETQVSAKTSIEDVDSELRELCSGTFEETQKTVSINALMSQIPITQNVGKQLNDNELAELCSGTFDEPSVPVQSSDSNEISEQIKTKCNKILSSDEESVDSEEFNKKEINKQRVKKLSKKLNKKKPKLGFSDDEDEITEGVHEDEIYEDDKQELEVSDDNLESNTDEPDTFVDYDSEENEIIVKMTRNDKVIQAQKFFEKEAELSESEWGSADEDENNLDKYDIELGDEDEFDRSKLQAELGQIHARKMLDEDIREVRKIQEMLFEDEEKDGVGRQRTFRWKNAESGFSLDDGRHVDEIGDSQNGESGDEMNEHQWRKIRYEREQFLKEKGLKTDSQDTSSVLPDSTIHLSITGETAFATKKLQIVTSKKTVLSTSDTKNVSPFLISKGISAMHKKSVRGSFLVRDKETLNKLAGLTKVTASSMATTDEDDAAGTVSIKSIKAKNFVFATLTEEEHENLKRKADDLLNSSNENGKNYMKKPKMEPRRDKCFIDQLL